MNASYKIVPKLNFTMTGPLKKWRSVKHAHIYHYDVTHTVRRLFFRPVIESQRVVCVEIEFTNGVRFSSHGLFKAGRDSEISLLAVYRALREFSKQASIQPA